MMYSLRTQSATGFSLVETLVSITILLIVIVGPMSIATTANRGADFSNQQIIAYFLAQEGLELAQNARDNLQLANWDDGVDGDGWAEFVDDTSGVYQSCFTNTGCGLEIEEADGDIDVIDCSTNSCRLYFDDDVDERSRFTYDSGGSHERTDFTRIIFMDTSSGVEEVEVVSQVRWRPEGQFSEQMIETNTYLLNAYDE